MTHNTYSIPHIYLGLYRQMWGCRCCDRENVWSFCNVVSCQGQLGVSRGVQSTVGPDRDELMFS